MFTVVNAADMRRHPGFERFTEGPGCSPVAGLATVCTVFSHAQYGRSARRRPLAGPGPGPRACTLSIHGTSATKKRRQQKLISFIWSPGNPLPAGTGGSENYTVGQVRELKRRGIPAQGVTVGLGADDGRADFTGIPFPLLTTL